MIRTKGTAGRPGASSAKAIAQLYAFTPFPDENWEAATPAELLPEVSKLREKLQEDVETRLDKSEARCEAPDPKLPDLLKLQAVRQSVHQAMLSAYDDLRCYSNRGREPGVFNRHVGMLLDDIIGNALRFAGPFRGMAIAHDIGGDPVNWAYAQIHSVLSGLFGLPEGLRLKLWLMRICDGSRAIDADAWARNPLAGLKADLRLAMLWQAPAWLAVCLLRKTPAWLPAHLSEKDYWPRLDKENTKLVRETFVRGFWDELNSKLEEKLEAGRSLLAQVKPQALPRPAAQPVQPSAPSPQVAQSGEGADSQQTTAPVPSTTSITRHRDPATLGKRVAGKLDNPSGNPTMTVEEVAHVFSTSKSSIYRWISVEGKLTWASRGRISTQSVIRLLTKPE